MIAENFLKIIGKLSRTVILLAGVFLVWIITNITARIQIFNFSITLWNSIIRLGFFLIIVELLCKLKVSLKESEWVVGKPQRKRIASVLMVLENAGFVTMIATFANLIRPVYLP